MSDPKGKGSGYPELLMNLKKGLRLPRPGQEAQWRMAPRPRSGRVPESRDEDCRPAGVLVLVYPRWGRMHVALMRRSENLPVHQSQISFPGGGQRPGEDIRQTAFRETEEELGLPADRITVLGELTPLHIPPTHFCVYPVVACLDREPVFRPSPGEVAEVLEVAVEEVMDPGCIQEETWTIRGIEADVPFYRFGKHKIWGATAMVLAELAEVIRRAVPEEGA